VLLRGLVFLLGSASAACTAQPEPEATPPVEEVRGPFRVLSTRESVPPFRLVATDGSVFDSNALIGKRAFVVVFFTTWCGVCELKLPEVSAVAKHTRDDVTFVGVPIDDPDTWDQVAEYVDRLGLGFPIVRGEHFPRFTMAYDPMQKVPVVAVVGKDGYLVDYQVGWGPSHGRRLRAAVDIARGDPAYTGAR
jgi:thiol-disulfide isomerase/thioredoxin